MQICRAECTFQADTKSIIPAQASLISRIELSHSVESGPDFRVCAFVSASDDGMCCDWDGRDVDLLQCAGTDRPVGKSNHSPGGTACFLLYFSFLQIGELVLWQSS